MIPCACEFGGSRGGGGGAGEEVGQPQGLGLSGLGFRV